jgi:hypothetical protein
VIHGQGATAAAFAPTGFDQPAVVLPPGFAYPASPTGAGPGVAATAFAPPLGNTTPNAKRPNVALFAASGVAVVAILVLVGVLAFNAGSHRDSDATAVTGATGAATGGTANATSAAPSASAATTDPAQALAPLTPPAAQGAQGPAAAATPGAARPRAGATGQSSSPRPVAAAGSPAANTTAANTPPASHPAPASDDDGDRPSAVHQFFNGLGHTVKRTVNQVTQ